MNISEYNKFLEDYKVFLETKAQNPINLERKELQNTGLSETELSLILGGILGDGSLKIHQNYVNARYSFRHSITQEKYFFWKAEKLRGICSKKYIWRQDPDFYSKNEKIRFGSRAMEPLTKVLKLTHTGNHINVQRSWLNHLTPLSLAIWWCDDGSIISNNTQGCLSTDGFPPEAQDIIVQYFKKTWNIEFKVYEVTYRTNKNKTFSTKKFKRLYIMQNSLKKFLTIIMPYIPCKEMVYKCALRYNDQLFQERWISHMEELLPQPLKSEARLFYKKPDELQEKNIIVQNSYDDDNAIFTDLNGNTFENVLPDDFSLS